MRKKKITPEEAFEFLYGYPMRLAQNVIDLGAAGGMSEEVASFHRERVEFVKGIFEEPKSST